MWQDCPFLQVNGFLDSEQNRINRCRFMGDEGVRNDEETRRHGARVRIFQTTQKPDGLAYMARNVVLTNPPLASIGQIGIYTGSIPMARDLSVIVQMAEGRASVAVDQAMGTGKWPGFRHNHTLWRVQSADAENERSIAMPQPMVERKPHHDGWVYCIKTPNKNVLARRKIEWDLTKTVATVKNSNQKPFFTGAQ